MQWEAANVARRPQDPNQENLGVVVEASDATTTRRSAETAEAALSRLTKSYSAAITCVGALHRTSTALQRVQATDAQATGSNLQNNELSGSGTAEQLQRVANAARISLESGVLLDPLIRAHIPTVYQTMQEFSEESSSEANGWIMLLNSSRPVPPVLSSSAHRSTVRELAYLSLVNYGDLLLSGCSCSPKMPKSKANTVLDRGMVTRLGIMPGGVPCCWKGETEEHTQRLALVAFCDASEIQGSDPILWLKLACTARGLDRMLAHRSKADGCSNSVRRYGRLERYALECGKTALPIEFPPNRTIVCALEELSHLGFPEAYPPKLVHNTDCVEIELDLPRYSWSILGRMLMKACREGASYGFNTARGKRSLREHKEFVRAESFGSPKVTLRISPMLALPSSVLSTICQFLTSDCIWRFEATCRALSVSIISARASMEQEIQTSTEMQNRSIAASRIAQDNNNSSDALDDHRAETDDRTGTEENRGAVQHERRTSSHRSSKRVRSQQITSGKLAERSAKRNSVEFCFLASTLSCTSDHNTYNSLLREAVVWESLVPVKYGACARVRSLISASSIAERGHVSCPENQSQNRRRNEARERSGDGSLTSFIGCWNSKNSGPLDVLYRFVSHVSLNVENVFSTDPGGMMVLASCVTDSKSPFLCMVCASKYGTKLIFSCF